MLRRRKRSIESVAALRVIDFEFGVNLRVGQAGVPRISFHFGDGLGGGLGPERGRSTRLTSRPTAARLRASARVAAASASTGIVTSTVLPIPNSPANLL